LTGWLSIAASRAAANDHSKHFSNHRGGQAASQTTSKSSASHKPQWSADPIRGWVRTEERQDVPKPGAAAKSDRDKGKSKTNSKATRGEMKGKKP
jgi:hypothetical protein